MQIQNHKKLGLSSGFRDINIRRKIPNFVDTFAQICGVRGERTYLGLSMYRNQCNPRDHFVIGNISIFPLIAALIESRHMSSRSKGSYLQLMEKQNWTVCCFQARAPAPFVATTRLLSIQNIKYHIVNAPHVRVWLYQISHCHPICLPLKKTWIGSFPPSIRHNMVSNKFLCFSLVLKH